MPAAVVEPVATREPVVTREPVATREPIAAREPVATPSAPPAPSVFQRPVDPDLFVKPSPVREQPAAGDRSTRVEEHLVSLLAPSSFVAEQYRALRFKVEQMHKMSNLAVVGVTSPEAGDGKTMTSINLAGALAQAPEARVLIVDADLRRSSTSKYLGLDDPRGRGLVGAILDPHISLRDAVETCPPFNLSILRAGRRPSAPYELLKSPRLGQLLEEARHHYDYVILDMPPLVPLPDCGVIGRWVDGFLIVVAANKTPRKMVEEALKVLDPSSVIGLIFNGNEQRHPGYYGSYASNDPGKWWGRAAQDSDEDGAL